MNQVVSREKLVDWLESLVTSLGFELVDVQWVSERGRYILRLLVDREGGMTLDHCVQLSREVSTHLDVAGLISSAYHLEVSSPGLDRPLKKKKDFEKFLGSVVKVQTKRPIAGRAHYKGVLLGVGDSSVRLEVDRHEYELLLDDIFKANVVFTG